MCSSDLVEEVCARGAGSQMVYLIGRNPAQQCFEPALIGKVVFDQLDLRQRPGAHWPTRPFDRARGARDSVTTIDQQLGQVASILAGDTRD